MNECEVCRLFREQIRYLLSELERVGWVPFPVPGVDG